MFRTYCPPWEPNFPFGMIFDSLQILALRGLPGYLLPPAAMDGTDDFLFVFTPSCSTPELISTAQGQNCSMASGILSGVISGQYHMMHGVTLLTSQTAAPCQVHCPTVRGTAAFGGL